MHYMIYIGIVRHFLMRGPPPMLTTSPAFLLPAWPSSSRANRHSSPRARFHPFSTHPRLSTLRTLRTSVRCAGKNRLALRARELPDTASPSRQRLDPEPAQTKGADSVQRAAAPFHDHRLHTARLLVPGVDPGDRCGAVSLVLHLPLHKGLRDLQAGEPPPQGWYGHHASAAGLHLRRGNGARAQLPLQYVATRPWEPPRPFSGTSMCTGMPLRASTPVLGPTPARCPQAPPPSSYYIFCKTDLPYEASYFC